jgi:diaminohydroxyphosphoribosylaminopyrimidine deaminase/5-amino-6-(5-phosphoribosylamino)uracil reductase
LCQAEAVALNIGFFSRMQRGRPWLRMKMATSLDGVSALPNGQSQWITSAQARADGHAWRARACAILTGYGTVRPAHCLGVATADHRPLRIHQHAAHAWVGLA